MDGSWQVELPTSVDAAHVARQTIRQRLESKLDHAAIVDAQIVVGELVTYGIRNGSASLRLRAWLDGPLVCVEVAGVSTGAAASFPADMDALQPEWGPRLIQALAHAWGVRDNALWVRLKDPADVRGWRAHRWP